MQWLSWIEWHQIKVLEISHIHNRMTSMTMMMWFQWAILLVLLYPVMLVLHQELPKLELLTSARSKARIPEESLNRMFHDISIDNKEKSRKLQQIRTSKSYSNASFVSARSKMLSSAQAVASCAARIAWESGWLSKGNNVLTVEAHFKFINLLAAADLLKKSQNILIRSMPFNLRVVEMAQPWTVSKY